ncbi:hypothetical protein PoMZ_07169 [Pyricularia oryzae]|uniref:Uncharacterized protein n=1 Tax=Pyricularia oryzae TaxID=318829 RepID=A0A4P7NEG7_PYROR|nr:hypothetical protein PoMZ_07169 [Pyricularia oryzae]
MERLLCSNPRRSRCAAGRLEAHGNGISIILRQRNGKKAPKVAE